MSPLVEIPPEQKPVLTTSFRIAGGVHTLRLEATEENKELLKTIRIMAAKDGWSVGRLIREAVLEYIKGHSPGNPQLILGHWQSEIPLPLSVQGQHKHRWHGKSDGAGIWYECDDCSETWVPP